MWGLTGLTGRNGNGNGQKTVRKIAVAIVALKVVVGTASFLIFVWPGGSSDLQKDARYAEQWAEQVQSLDTHSDRINVLSARSGTASLEERAALVGEILDLRQKVEDLERDIKELRAQREK